MTKMAMHRIVGWLVGGALFSTTFLLGPTTLYACHHDGDMGRKEHTRANVVSVDASGVTKYDIAGICIIGPQQTSTEHAFFSATGTWTPGLNHAVEYASGDGAWHGLWSGQVQSTWACPADPWLSPGVLCGLVGYSAVGGGDSSPPTERPFSASHGPAAQLRDQYSKAVPGPPALPPRDATATLGRGPGLRARAHINWTIPADQTSMHRTIAWFRVERRPAGTSVPWFSASTTLPATATAFSDPDPLQSETEYRVCAGNMSGMTCSDPPITPDSRVFQAVKGSPRPYETAVAESGAAQTGGTASGKSPNVAVKENYFSGKLLSAGDLSKEQEYTRDRRDLRPATPKADHKDLGVYEKLGKENGNVAYALISGHIGGASVSQSSLGNVLKVEGSGNCALKVFEELDGVALKTWDYKGPLPTTITMQTPSPGNHVLKVESDKSSAGCGGTASTSFSIAKPGRKSRSSER